jgi:hypothetical protein
MGTRNISWLVKAAGALGLPPYHLDMPIVMTLVALVSWNPQRLSRPVQRLFSSSQLMTGPKSQRSGIPNETRYHVVFAAVVHLSGCAVARLTLNNDEQCWKVNM